MITLAPPRPLDVRRTFRWLQDDRLGRDFMLSAKPTLEGHFRYWKNVLTGRSGDLFFSVIHDGAHVGNCGVKNITDDCAEIWLYLGVDSHRGLGFGSAIMAELIRFACERSVKLIYLHVRQDNTAAISLYRKFGFGEVSSADGEILGFNADVFISRMELRL